MSEANLELSVREAMLALDTLRRAGLVEIVAKLTNELARRTEASPAAAERISELEAENAALRAELKKASRNARVRTKRRELGGQETLFERAVENVPSEHVSKHVSDPHDHDHHSIDPMMIGDARAYARPSGESLDREHPPEWYVDLARERRQDMSDDELRNRFWRFFVSKHAVDDADARDHFEKLLKVHRVRPPAAAEAEQAAAPPASTIRPTTKARPRRAVDSPAAFSSFVDELAASDVAWRATGPPATAPGGA